jgi:hypothetical protein
MPSLLKALYPTFQHFFKLKDPENVKVPVPVQCNNPVTNGWLNVHKPIL